MKKIGIICFLVFNILIINAQAPVGKGGKQLNFGLGFDNWGIPVYGGLDFGVHPDITLGGEIALGSWFDHALFGFIFDGNYHFNRLLEISREWDVYAGLNLGIYYSSDKYYYNRGSNLNLGFQLGGRYYFTPKWAFNLEFRAASFPNGKIGLSYKL